MIRKRKNKVTRFVRASMLVALVVAITGTVNAQVVKRKVPVITLGRIAATEIKNGKPIPTPSSRNEILKNGLLLADVINCRVTEYKFSLIAPGADFYGPIYVKGGELTDSIKHKIRLQDGPGVKLYIEEVKIVYRDDSMAGNSVYVSYDN
jgi:hypothetical protein